MNTRERDQKGRFLPLSGTPEQDGPDDIPALPGKRLFTHGRALPGEYQGTNFDSGRRRRQVHPLLDLQAHAQHDSKFGTLDSAHSQPHRSH